MTSASIYGANNTPLSDTASFVTTFNNPCLDSNYVSISNVALFNQIYELFEYDPVGYQFTHDPFTLVINPSAHDLCGTLTYITTFDGNSINDVSEPLGYHATNRTFDLYSEDMSLVG